MEFLIYLTKNCNIDCRYCSAKSFINDRAQDGKEPDVEKTAEFILKHRGNGGSEVVFFGGEPLLNREWIKKFMERTLGNNLRYTIQTNGVLLDRLDPFILENLDYLSLSIDGDRRTTDEGRGAGVYDTLLENLAGIKPHFRGKTLARMTLCPENPLYESVTHLLDLKRFDFIYWQLQNSPYEIPAGEVKARYRTELGKLAGLWMDGLREGISLPIIPLHEAALSLLGLKSFRTYRCGAASFQVIVDLDGRCYTCVELLEPEDEIGSIEGSVRQKPITAGNFLNFCLKCDILNLCGGRCLMTAARYTPEKFSFYCDMTRILFDTVRECLPELKKILQGNRLTLQDLKCDFSTEEIP
jgi:putative peptide-modifying radical SAM enzyme